MPKWHFPRELGDFSPSLALADRGSSAVLSGSLS